MKLLGPHGVKRSCLGLLQAIRTAESRLERVGTSVLSQELWKSLDHFKDLELRRQKRVFRRVSSRVLMGIAIIECGTRGGLHTYCVLITNRQRWHVKHVEKSTFRIKLRDPTAATQTEHYHIYGGTSFD